MAKLAIGFGVVLGLIGAGFFVATGNSHPTALIPLWFGCALIICGGLASTQDPRRRMLWMHIAVTISLLGFLFSGFWAIKLSLAAQAAPLSSPAVQDCALMSVLCLIFTALCVRSFIAARRSRAA